MVVETEMLRERKIERDANVEKIEWGSQGAEQSTETNNQNHHPQSSPRRYKQGDKQ